MLDGSLGPARNADIAHTLFNKLEQERLWKCAGNGFEAALQMRLGRTGILKSCEQKHHRFLRMPRP